VNRKTVQRLLVSASLALWILFLGLLALSAGTTEGQFPLPPSVVGQLVNGVSSAELERHICHLQDRDALGYCNTQGSRYTRDPAALQEAADYIANRFAALGLDVTLDPLPFPREDESVITNVIGTLEGLAPSDERQVWIISAHYDSIASSTPDWTPGDPAPGADDNASGVAAVLEAARLLSRHRFYHTVRFIAFAGEEQGSYGSRHYASQARARGEPIAGVLNLDMIGYETDGAPWFEIHAGLDPGSAFLANAVTRTVEAYGLDLLPQVWTAMAIGRSDHESFWEQGFPALLLIEDTELRGPTQDWNPYYHTVNDTLDKLNLRFLQEMARAAVGSLAHLARPMAPDLQIHLSGPSAVVPGSQVRYTLTFTNTGVEGTTGVVVTQTLSNGLVYVGDSSGWVRSFHAGGSVSWQIGELAPGEGGSFVVTATVATDLPLDARVFSRVVIAPASLDADGADNVAEVRSVVHPLWHLYLPLVRDG